MTAARVTDPEHAFVACLMSLPPRSCVELTELCTRTDFEDTKLRFIIDIVRRLALEDGPVDPVSVLGAIRRNGGIGDAALDDVSALVADLATNVDHPLFALHYLQLVLERSVRQSVNSAGMRLVQASDSEPFPSLESLTAKELASCKTEFARLAKVQAQR